MGFDKCVLLLFCFLFLFNACQFDLYLAKEDYVLVETISSTANETETAATSDKLLTFYYYY